MGRRTLDDGTYFAYGSLEGYNKRKCPYCDLQKNAVKYFAFCKAQGGRRISDVYEVNECLRCMGRSPNKVGRYTQCPYYKKAKAEKQQARNSGGKSSAQRNSSRSSGNTQRNSSSFQMNENVQPPRRLSLFELFILVVAIIALIGYCSPH